MQYTCSVGITNAAEPQLDLQQLWDLELLGMSRSEEKNLTLEEYQAQLKQDECTWYDRSSKTWHTSLLFKENLPRFGYKSSKSSWNSLED